MDHNMSSRKAELLIQQQITDIYNKDVNKLLSEMYNIKHPLKPVDHLMCKQQTTQRDRCQYTKQGPNGERCIGTAELYPWFCDAHGLSIFEMNIAPSTIPHAGLGLFTQIELAKGDFIALYTGELLFPHEYALRYPQQDSDYCIEHSFLPIRDTKSGKIHLATAENAKSFPKGQFVPVTIDARSSQACLARYINDPLNSHLYMPNAIFKPFQGQKCVHIIVVAECDIPAGAEIFVAYGENYTKRHAM
jgi:hypothetical protein